MPKKNHENGVAKTAISQLEGGQIIWFTALCNLNLNGFVNRGLYAMLSQANKGMAKWYVTKVGMSPGTREQNQLSTLHLRGTLAEVLV